MSIGLVQWLAAVIRSHLGSDYPCVIGPVEVQPGRWAVDVIKSHGICGYRFTRYVTPDKAVRLIREMTPLYGALN